MEDPTGTPTSRSKDAPPTADDDAAIMDLEHVKASPDAPETILLKVGTDDSAVGPAGDTKSTIEMDTPAKVPNRRYQRYRTSWEKIPELKDWLEAVEGDPHTAWCRHCGCGLTCHLKNLMVHAKSTKHKKRKMTRQRTPAPQASAVCRGDVPPVPPAPVSYGDAERINYSIGLHNQTVGFVGGGCIAQAMLRGLLDRGIVSPGNVIVSAPSSRNLTIWKRWGCSSTQDNAETVHEADLIFVAVKPQVAEAVFKELGAAAADGRERCFVSLVTGWSRQRIIQTMTSGVPVDGAARQCHVVRCVPNLSVSIGEGSSVYCYGTSLPRRWLLAVEMVFSALGTCREAAEYLMDTYSGAFSSGTAFVLTFIDALASGAVNLGVSWHEALQMAAKTTSGAARLVLESERSPSELRRDASSAGAGTLAGTMALQKAGLEYAVMSAVQAASERCSQLGGAGGSPPTPGAGPL